MVPVFSSHNVESADMFVRHLLEGISLSRPYLYHDQCSQRPRLFLGGSFPAFFWAVRSKTSSTVSKGPHCHRPTSCLSFCSHDPTHRSKQGKRRPFVSRARSLEKKTRPEREEIRRSEIGFGGVVGGCWCIQSALRCSSFGYERYITTPKRSIRPFPYAMSSRKPCVTTCAHDN